ncbi:MAG: hypothetical protein QOI32_2015 [Thermoleophilaceae bacterium]|nr:hypothetical protein [Thermoleophilaceae bacterium]
MQKLDTPETPPTELKRRRGRIMAYCALPIPLLAGISVGARWPHADSTFYETVAQLIVTLVIAIAVEVVTDRDQQPGSFGLSVPVLLFFAGWIGLLASVRVLAGPTTGTSLTAGSAAAGLTAMGILTSLALFERVERSRPTTSPYAAFAVVAGYLLAVILVFIVL